MKKIVYISAILIYGAISIFGFAENAYIEVDAGEKLLKSNGVWIALVTIIVGAAVSYYFTKVFSKAWSVQKKAGKIVLPILFVLVSFGATLGIFHFYNSHLGKRTPFIIDGFIVSRWQKSGSRKSKSYFINMRDFASGTSYEFKVKRNVYQQSLLSGGSIKKEFYKGSLGIIYRNSY